MVFCESVRIPSKDIGLAPLILMDSQRYLIETIFWGLSQDRHDFVIVKARQLGASTVLWALDLFWLTKFSIQAMYIADDEANKELHRDVIGQMYLSLPRAMSRGPWRVNNRYELTWLDQKRADGSRWAASRMMWAFANKRHEGQLGRSRGVNYIHAEELDSWQDEEGVAALEATRSSVHPQRLYLWVGTGQGHGILYQMWDQAEHSLSSVPIFIGFWRRPDYTVTRQDRAMWEVYGVPPWSPEEREWAAEVKTRYGHVISKPQLAWWRKTLREGKGIDGDEAKMLQEYPWLPEQAFQASGSRFLSATTCLRLRTGLRHAPQPAYYRYDWGATFDAKGDEVLVEVPVESATLTIWEEPRPDAVYVVAGDPAYGSSAEADSFAITVWRAHPDQLIQVAEFHTTLGTMYQFAWVLAHLGGNYPRYMIRELNGPGKAVLQEMDRMANYGYGLANRGGALQNVVAAIQHYLYKRADALTGTYSFDWLMTSQNREIIMEKLRDAVERGALVVRSEDLTEELAALRRDEGRIEAGGVMHDDLAVTAALAVECWTETVIPEIESFVAPSQPDPREGRDVTERLVATFLRRIQMHAASEEPERPPFGVTQVGPGR